MALVSPEILVYDLLKTALPALRTDAGIVKELFRLYSKEEKEEILTFFTDENDVKVFQGWPARGTPVTVPSVVVEPSQEQESVEHDFLGDYAGAYQGVESAFDEIEYSSIVMKNSNNLLCVARDARQAIALQRIVLAILINSNMAFEAWGYKSRTVSTSVVSVRSDLLPAVAVARAITLTGFYYFNVGKSETLLDIAISVIVRAQAGNT